MDQLPGDRTSFCVVGDQAVCLDLRRDRYFLLRGIANEGLCKLSARIPIEDDEKAALEALEERGILRGILGERRRPLLAAAARSYLDEAPVSTGPADYVALAVAIWLSKRSLSRGLESAIARSVATRPPVAKSRHELRSILKVAWAYDRAVPFMRTYDQCLLRSIAMYRQLVRAGQGVNLVIGVALRPFQAHCWVQREDLVLNDSFDAVRTFTPILIL